MPELLTRIAAPKTRTVFASTHDWWTWHHARIRDALHSTRLARMSAVIEGALEANEKASRTPATWTELCSGRFIRRDEHHLKKVTRGSNGCTNSILLGFATALRLDVRTLIPDTMTWLAGATVHLSRDRILDADAIQYVTFRLRPHITSPSRNGHSHKPVEPGIARVLQTLEPILVSLDQEIEIENARRRKQNHG